MIPERFRTIWGTRTFSTPCATRRWRRTDLKTAGRIKCSAGYGVGSEILRKSKCKNHRNNACKVTPRGNGLCRVFALQNLHAGLFIGANDYTPLSKAVESVEV